MKSRLPPIHLIPRTVPRRISLSILVGSLVAVGGAYGSAFFPGGTPTWAPGVLLVGSVSALLAVSLLGAASQASGADLRLLVPLGLTFALLVGGVGGGLLLAPPEPGDRLFAGLPAGAALLVYGAGLLPLLVVPLAYAWTFDRAGFGEEEWERVRERALRARERAPREEGEAGRAGGKTPLGGTPPAPGERGR